MAQKAGIAVWNPNRIFNTPVTAKPNGKNTRVLTLSDRIPLMSLEKPYASGKSDMITPSCSSEKPSASRMTGAAYVNELRV
jgi:hypothetical protein